MNASWTGYLPAVVREWLDGREQLQTVIGNTGWLVGERVVRMVIGLTVGAWVARYLGPAQFGELAYILSFVAFFQLLADLQADGIIIRDISQERVSTEEVLGSALWLRLSVGLCSWVAAVAGMALFHPDQPKLIVLAAVVGGTLMFQASDLVDDWFQSETQSKRTVKAKVTAYLISNGVKVCLLLLKAPLLAFAAVTTIESALIAAAMLAAYRKYPTPERWRGNWRQAKRLLGLCWPFLISGLMVTAYMRVDQIMLKEMLGDKTLGIYAAALPLAQVWNVIPTTLVASVAPYIARRKGRGEAEYREALVIIFRFFAIVSLACASLTALLAPWVIGLLYGPQYQESARVLSLVVFVIVFIFQGFAQTMWIVNDDARFVTLISTAAAALLNVAGNAVLIRQFGIMGAVYSYLLAQAAAVVVIPCLLRPDLRDLYQRAFLGRRPPKSAGTVTIGRSADGAD